MILDGDAHGQFQENSYEMGENEARCFPSLMSSGR